MMEWSIESCFTATMVQGSSRSKETLVADGHGERTNPSFRKRTLLHGLSESAPDESQSASFGKYPEVRFFEQGTAVFETTCANWSKKPDLIAELFH